MELVPSFYFMGGLIMHDIDYYRKMAFDAKQMQIIRDGLKEGLDVEWYANTSFDYLQMEQIYEALKVGLDDNSLNMLCDPRIPYDSMKQMREQIFKQLGIYEKASEDVKRKKLMRYVAVSIVITVFIVLGSIIYINREMIGSYFEDPQLILKEDRIRLGLSQHFVASDYIEKYDKKYRLVLPEQKTFPEVGTYTVSYKLSNDVKTIEKDLIIDVYDDISPVIRLNSSNVVLDYGAGFDPQNYVDEVTDNVDGNLSDKLEYEGTADTSIAGNYQIIYKVEDLSGNSTTAQLNVTVKDKPVESDTNSNTNNSSKKNNINSDGTDENKSNAASFNRFFEGYSIASYNAACSYADELMNSGKISGYEVKPTGDGIQVICY